MKSIIIGISFLLGAEMAQAQRTKIFSLSPMTKETATVNGMVLGIGHFQESQYLQHVNGVNVDLFVVSPIALILAIEGIDSLHSFRYQHPESTTLLSNGVNLALGGFYRGTVHNGISIAMYNLGKAANGISINVAYNSVVQLSGLHISGIGNFSGQSSGINIGIYNQSGSMVGLQLGIANRSARLVGLQLGIYNKTIAIKGLQLGLINTNAKRTLPFINF